MENIKLVVSDLDGTLINSDWVLSDFAKEVVTELLNKGIEFVPSSARIFKEIPEWMRNKKQIRYIICENGAKIYNNLTKECLLSNTIHWDKAIAIIRQLEKINPYWTCSINGHLYSHRIILDDAEKLNIRGGYLENILATRTFIDELDEIKTIPNNDVNKIHFITDTRIENEILKEATKSLCDVRVGSSYIKNIEISHPLASKGFAVSYLQDLLSISIEETMVLGDNENDLSMLERSAHSVAVGIATDHVKASARYLAKSNKEEGAALFLKENLL